MQMNRQEIFERLKDILLMSAENKQDIIDACTESSNLATDIGLSSVGILYIVIAIEETFNIRFDNVGTADLATVKDVIDYIEAKLK